MKKNLIFGLHAIEALLQKKPQSVLTLYVLKERDDQKIKKIIQFAHTHDVPLQYMSRKSLDGLAQVTHHQGVVAEISTHAHHQEEDLKEIIENLEKPALLLILDGVQDPHNLGACLRTADAAGVDAVIAPKDRSVGLTAAVTKVASGAAEVVPFIQVTNLARTIRGLKEQGVWIFGTSDDAEKTIYEENFKIPTAFVLGNEEKGLRHLTREHCDVLLKIPMQGFVSSLNVSVATGVCLYEVVRQRSIF